MLGQDLVAALRAAGHEVSAWDIRAGQGQAWSASRPGPAALDAFLSTLALSARPR
jgi:hypothetical protein